MKGILGKKVGMTQIFRRTGEVIPVTVIEAGPCFVAQIKTVERDGYDAVQLGFDETKPKRLTNPQLKHLQKSNLPALRFLREFRMSPDDMAHLELSEGAKVTVDIFEAGEYVDVIGTSKGRGFAGVVKRHGFRGGSQDPRPVGQASSPGLDWCMHDPRSCIQRASVCLGAWAASG
jgi:large subunit ribosomal protein L3